jgi:glycosyltransferase involved in cell wall biosynthesis
VFAGEIGGVHPALVEAMASGNAILYLDTPANRETVCGCGVPFEAVENDLTSKMAQLIEVPAESNALAQCARQAAIKNYSWEHVTDKYEALFQEMLGRR